MSKYLMAGMAGFLLGLRYRLLGRKLCMKRLYRRMTRLGRWIG